MGGCAHKQPLLNGFVEVGRGAVSCLVDVLWVLLSVGFVLVGKGAATEGYVKGWQAPASCR